MSSRDLLLNQSALFCLSLGQECNSEGKRKEGIIARLRFSCSVCYIVRDLYWENIALYPTANLLEVYKIVQAEIENISPVAGRTFAYIVNSSKNSTAVLYCCFPEEIMARAKSYHLWRLLPETLAYYRYLYGKSGVYQVKLQLSSANIILNDENVSDGELTPCSEVLIKIDGDTCSSLPVNKAKVDMFTVAMMEEATVIKENETRVILNKFNFLNIIDLSVQSVHFIINIVNKKGYLARYVAIVLITFVLTFMLGKSAMITWHNNYLTEKVAHAKSIAVESLKLSNELKNIKSDINKINAVMELQLSKKKLLNILSGLVDKDNGLEFLTIDISPEEMQLRGTIKNSASFLTALSNVHGFDEVAFNLPPATLKSGLERFFIKLRFDRNINKNKMKSEFNE